MSKSIYVVGAIGLIGCVAMSLMMQHLLKVKGERSRPAAVVALEGELADHLSGPIEHQTLEIDGLVTLQVRLRTRAGVEAKALGRAAGEMLWRGVIRWQPAPERILVEVQEAGSAAPVVVESSQPGLRLRPRPTAQPSAPGK